MATLILGAFDGELTEFRNHLAGRREQRWHDFTFSLGRFETQEVIVAGTGVGKTMSALATQRFIDLFAPERILYTGIAGALNRELSVGDVVVAADSLQYDLDARAAGFELGRVPFTTYRYIPSDPELVAAAMQFEPEGFRLIEGRVLTGDLFLSRATDDTYGFLLSELGGDAVEMEGASAGLVALVNRIPYLLVRVISDRADGAPEVGLKGFLPIASKRAFLVVRHVLASIA
jgi:5'-methylthioadenosine/S-adenosylhomocysteine nucleosidase